MNIKEYIKSGLLEVYALGLASPEEKKEIEELANLHPEIQKEIDEIRLSLESHSKSYSKKPADTVKPLLLATIDYMERLKAGEPLSFPPELNENSSSADYNQWLKRADMKLPGDFDGIFAKLIGHTPAATTAIVWIKEMAPEEVHDTEFERFLIVEGECDIVVDNEINHLVPGNYFSIPLHSKHHVKVTSRVPCKVILQRIAA